MHLPSVIYVCGQNFSPAHSGQQKRLEIVSDYLAEKYRENPRILVAPVRPMSAERLAATGWSWVQLSANLGPGWRDRLSRGWNLLGWRCFNRRPDRVLSMIGGAQLRIQAGERKHFSNRPAAMVLVGRCDLSGLVRFREPGQQWVLDSNDSVANLEGVYKYADHWRRLTGLDRDAWLSRLRTDEREIARHYDRIINICNDDREFFGAVAGDKVCVEDTDIVLPENQAAGTAKFNVGFIGGNHKGSVNAAANLIDLAGRPDMSQLRFGIAGRVCAELPAGRLPANVTLVGTVDDSLGFLRQCKCVVIFTGPETGASVKFQESLAAGCIIIANRNAARFSLARAGETHLEANTLEDVARLLSSGEVWRFSPRNLAGHFSRAAFHQRFAAALGWSGHD